MATAILRNIRSSLRKAPACRTYSQATQLPEKKTGAAQTRHFEEIQIPVPWGHIAGKWYGPKHVRPILGLHGWQDNSGTFDTLAPLLPPHVAFLCLDMPGHGMSSWYPPGMAYHSVDYVSLLLHLMDDYNWKQISIIGHSMMSLNGFIFAALFPDKVDMFIGLDVLKPHIRSAKSVCDALAQRLMGAVKVEQRIRNNSPPPSYEWDQLVERLHAGTEKSVDLDMCKYLLQRSVKPTADDPNKYYFSRDTRIRNSLFYTFAPEVPLEMARRIKCPHLFIKALQAPYYEHKKHYDDALAVLKQNPLFECHELEGSHHVHLNNPERVAPLINDFIARYRP